MMKSDIYTHIDRPTERWRWQRFRPISNMNLTNK